MNFNFIHVTGAYMWVKRPNLRRFPIIGDLAHETSRESKSVEPGKNTYLRLQFRMPVVYQQ